MSVQIVLQNFILFWLTEAYSTRDCYKINFLGKFTQTFNKRIAKFQHQGDAAQSLLRIGEAPHPR